MSRSSRFTRNAIANWLGFLFTAVVGFFLSPFVVEHLGATRYGVWSLIAGLVGYLGLLDLGIRQAVNRYTAHHRATGTHEESSNIVSAALRLFGFLGALALLVAAALAFLAPDLFNIPGDLVDDARAIILIGGATVAVTLVGGVFGGVVTGVERFDVQCGLDILVTTARATAIVVALKGGHALVALALIQLMSAALNCLVYWIAARRLYRELRIRLGGALGRHIRTIIAFSASLSVLYALGLVISYSDVLIVGAFLPIEAVTYFAIAGALATYAKELTRSLAYLMTPRVGALTSTGHDQIGELVVKVAGVATLVSTPIAVTFLVRGASFIDLWMGPAYGPLSGPVLQLLAALVWLEASRTVIGHSLTGMAKQHTVIPGVAVEAAAKITLSLLLVGPLGIAGVALGTLIPGVIVSLGYFPRSLTKATGVTFRRFCRDAIFLPTAACIPFGLATLALERYAPATNLAIFFLQTFLVLPLVLVIAWFVCLSPEERGALGSAIGIPARR